MRAAPSSLATVGPNKIRVVYLPDAARRVWGGSVRAVWGIFPACGASIGAIGLNGRGAQIGADGAKVGCVQSVDDACTHEIPPFFGRVRLMGRWAGPISGRRPGRPVAPLDVARMSRYPVARDKPEIWKISGQSPAFNMFMLTGSNPKLNLGKNGSGCAGFSRQFSFRRVGGRLFFAENAGLAAMCGLSGPGLEAPTLCAGRRHVN